MPSPPGLNRNILKRLLRDFFILFGLIVLCASNMHRAMDNIKAKRNNEKWWGEFQTKGGDLVGLSHLGFVKKFSSTYVNHVADRSAPDATGKHVLYLFGDSYAWNLYKSSFENLSDFHFIDKRYGRYAFRLDTGTDNILIIEIAERYFREYFESLQIFE